MDSTTQLVIVGRVALAALFGLVIGIEREYRGKSAGERTFALLAFAAAGFTALGAELLPPGGTSRVVQGVVTGVGFLGAGLIFRRKASDVRGLTTAAGAWAATAIGTLVGVGVYLSAALGTILVLFILELDAIPVLRRIHEAALRESSRDSNGGASSTS